MVASFGHVWPKLTESTKIRPKFTGTIKPNGNLKLEANFGLISTKTGQFP